MGAGYSNFDTGFIDPRIKPAVLSSATREALRRQFAEWTGDDVDAVLAAFEGHGELRWNVSWGEFFRTVDRTSATRDRRRDQRLRETYHTACHAYAMERDPDAAAALAANIERLWAKRRKTLRALAVEAGDANAEIVWTDDDTSELTDDPWQADSTSSDDEIALGVDAASGDAESGSAATAKEGIGEGGENPQGGDDAVPIPGDGAPTADAADATDADAAAAKPAAGDGASEDSGTAEAKEGAPPSEMAADESGSEEAAEVIGGEEADAEESSVSSVFSDDEGDHESVTETGDAPTETGDGDGDVDEEASGEKKADADSGSAKGAAAEEAIESLAEEAEEEEAVDGPYFPPLPTTAEHWAAEAEEGSHTEPTAFFSPIFMGIKNTFAADVDRAQDAELTRAYAAEAALGAHQGAALFEDIAALRAKREAEMERRSQAMAARKRRREDLGRMRLSERAAGAEVMDKMMLKSYNRDQDQKEEAVKARELDEDQRSIEKQKEWDTEFEAEYSKAERSLTAFQDMQRNVNAAPRGRLIEKKLQDEMDILQKVVREKRDERDNAVMVLEQTRLDTSVPRGLVVMAETTVIKVRAALETVEENERTLRIQLSGAAELAAREETWAPLFWAFAKPSRSRAARGDHVNFVDVIVAIAASCGAANVERVALLFFACFDVAQRQAMNRDELTMLVAALVRVFERLGGLTRRMGAAEVAAAVQRAVGNAQAITRLEFQRHLSNAVRRSKSLSALFSVRWQFGEFGTYQRKQMHPISLFTVGLVDLAQMRRSVNAERLVARPKLMAAPVLHVHSRALALGYNDPTKADYSRFFLRKKKEGERGAIPLKHGVYSNVQVHRDNVASKAARTLQTNYRAKRGRGAGNCQKQLAALSKEKALKAKEIARVVRAEFGKRESLKGVAKIKWKAKVRMVQVKLRAEGVKGGRKNALVWMMKEETDMRCVDIDAEFREKLVAMDLHTFTLKRFGVADPEPIGEFLEKIDVGAYGASDRGDFLESLADADDAEKQHVAARRLEILLGKEEDDNPLPPIWWGHGAGGAENPGMAELDSSEDDAEDRGSDRGEDDDAQEAWLVADAAAEDVDAAGAGAEGGMEGDHAAAEAPHDPRASKVEDEALAVADSETLALAKVDALKRAAAPPTGETGYLRALRRRLNTTASSKEHFIWRLRLVHPNVTQLKAEALYAQLPSKRLILRYVREFLTLTPGCGGGMAPVDFEFAQEPFAALMHHHFLFPPAAAQCVARFLLAMYKSSYAYTMRAAWLTRQQIASDLQLRKDAKVEVQRSLAAAGEIAAQRAHRRGQVPASKEAFDADEAEEVAELATLDELKEAEQVAVDALDVSRSAAQLKSEERRALSESINLRRALRGERTALMELSDIPHSLRRSWLDRLRAVLDMPNGEEAPSTFGAEGRQALSARAATLRVRRARALASLLHEFRGTVLRHAKTIVHEFYWADAEKSIKPFRRDAADGNKARRKAGVGAQALHTRFSKPAYRVENIEFTIALDYDGIFDGDDGAAAKAAANARRGAGAYLRCAAQGTTSAKFCAPLVTCVDFLGFRVLAEALPPLPYDDEQALDEAFVMGEVTRAAANEEEAGEGLRERRGVKLRNKSKPLLKEMAKAASVLGLTSHGTKGRDDLNPVYLPCAADVRGYRIIRGDQESFYITNLARTFPPECPSATRHLPYSSRGMTIFWRALRPELISPAAGLLGGMKLSPDTLSLFTYGCADEQQHEEALANASRILIETLVPAFAEELSQRQIGRPRAAAEAPKAKASVITEAWPAAAKKEEEEVMAAAARDHTEDEPRLTHGGIEEHDVTSEIPLAQLDDEWDESGAAVSAAALATRTPLDEAVAIDWSHEMHRRGISMRHLGLLRARFWRKLTGEVTARFGEPVVLTTSDLRSEVARGDRIRVADVEYRVSTSGTFDRNGVCVEPTPSQRRSQNELHAFSGSVDDDRNSTTLRMSLLAELVARAAKQLTRAYARETAALERNASEQRFIVLVVSVLNMLSGAERASAEWWQCELVPQIESHFGIGAISRHEAANPLRSCAPVLATVLKRLVRGLGLAVRDDTWRRVKLQPCGFLFQTADVLRVDARVRRDESFEHQAEAAIIAVDAKDARALTYRRAVLSDAPLGYWPLDDAYGSATAKSIAPPPENLLLGALAPSARQLIAHAKQGELAKTTPAATVDEGHYAGVERVLQRKALDAGGLKPSVRQIAAMEALAGTYSRGVKLRAPGFVKNDGAPSGMATPCCSFKEKGTSRVVVNAQKVLAPLWQLGGSGFSVETWAMVSPEHLNGRARTCIGTGRFTVMMLKSQRWSFVVFDIKSGQKISLICEEKVVLGKWYHLMCTFDSVTARLYVNGFVRGEADLDSAIRKRNRDVILERIRNEKELERLLEKGRLEARFAAAEEVNREIATDKKMKKDLAVGIKKAIKKSKFQVRLASKGKTPEQLEEEGIKPIDANEAQRMVIEEFIVKKETVLVDAIVADQHEQREAWLAAEVRAEAINAKRVLQPMRIGCGIPGGRHLNGADYFEGGLQHVAVYAHCVPGQRVLVHYYTATRNEDLAADRLNVLAARSLKRALRAAPTDATLLAQYAQALCDHCATDPDRVDRVELYSARVRSALAYFKKTGNGKGVIALMYALPRVDAYATLCCVLWVALRRLNLAQWSEIAGDAHDESTRAGRSALLAGITDAALTVQRDGESADGALRLDSAEDEKHSVGGAGSAASSSVASLDDFNAVEYVDEALINRVRAATCGATLNLPELDITHDIPGLDAEDSARALAELPDGFGLMHGGSNAVERAVATEMLRYAVHRIEVRFQPGAKANPLAEEGEEHDYPVSGVSFVAHCHTPSLVIYVIDRAVRKLDLCELDLSESCADILARDFDAFTDGSRHLKKLNVSQCVELDDDAVSLIAQRCPHLEALDLSGCVSVTDKSVVKLGSESFKLTSLSLSQCRRVTPKGLNPVLRSCTLIRELDLRELPNLNDSVLVAIGEALPRLRVLRLSQALRVSDDGLAQLALSMEAGCLAQQRDELGSNVSGVELEVLELDGCQRISDLGIIAMVQRCTRLKTLNLSTCELLTEKALVAVTHNCWDLEKLNVSDIPQVKDAPFWFDDINDGRPAVDRAMLSKLSDLNLDNCLLVNSRAFEGIGTRTEDRLLRLSAVGCKRFDIDAIESLTFDPVTRALRNQSLVFLDLSFCTAVDDEAVELLAERCAQLVTLRLTGCSKLTDGGIAHIAKKICGCQKLSLAHCLRLSDAATEVLVKTLWLEELNLSNCSRITDRSLFALAERAPGLVDLRLRWCVQVSSAGIEALAKRCNVLAHLDVSACDNVSDAALNAIKAGNAQLTVEMEPADDGVYEYTK